MNYSAVLKELLFGIQMSCNFHNTDQFCMSLTTIVTMSLEIAAMTESENSQAFLSYIYPVEFSGQVTTCHKGSPSI